MGAYLSKPKTDIEIEIGGNANLTYCCASMQGWRLHQEDAHNTIPNFDEECSLFAVYDGHGGAEVAQYASQNFPNFLKKLPIWSEQEKDFKKAFEDAFIGFDDRLRQPEVMRALSEIAAENKRGQNVEDEEEEIDEEELDSEKPQLMQEARLPLREVLGKYGVDSKDFMNIVMNYANQQMRKKEGTVKAEDADAPGPSGSAAGSSTRPTKRAGSPPPSSMDSSAKRAKVDDESCSDAKVEANGSASAHQENEEPKNESADKEADEAEKEEEDEESEDEDEEAEDGEDKSENGPGPSRAPLLNVDRFLRDVSGDSDSDEDYDEETDEAEAEEFIGAPIPGGGEIPGDDSGATACVVAVYKDKLVIANAGDSRAVLCRKKEAVDLSLDHKPEDDIERRRIYAAGGTISGDGRVNGGLNLSRALGDHFYKKNISIPLKDQMISALPDVKIETLTEDDTFLVVACDGIWNSMSSQQVINFVKERLDNGGELRFICEEICRHCLAEDTEGDGTGCDNITFMIVKLNTPYIAPPEDEEYAEKTAVEEKTPVEAEEAAVEAEEAAVEQE